MYDIIEKDVMKEKLMATQLFLNRGFSDVNVLEFGEAECAPNHEYGPNYRSYFLIHYVVSGKGVFECDGRCFSLSAGDAFIIKPNKIVHYKADEKEPWHYIWIGFTAQIKLHDKLDTPKVREEGLRDVFFSMRSVYDMQEGKEDFLCSCVWKIISLLKEKEKPKSLDYVERAKAYMEAGYSDKIKISELSKSLNLERTYFSALFKEKTGKSPQVYLNELRLSRGAELITRYGLSPTEAASAVGYSDLFAFSRMFKRHYGISPTEYKQNYIKRHEKK